MNMLSKNERDGLEYVFLSIHTNHNKFHKLKELLHIVLPKKRTYFIKKFIKEAIYEAKAMKFKDFINYFNKKKKNLRK